MVTPHQPRGFEPTEDDEERAVAHASCDRRRLRVPIDQSEHAGFRHTSGYTRLSRTKRP
jgi:hypothetical protein